MAAQRVLYHAALYNKGGGMFAPRDYEVGELIFAEDGFTFPRCTIDRPWPLPIVMEPLRYRAVTQLALDAMRVVVIATMEFARSHTSEGLEYPDDVSPFFERVVRSSRFPEHQLDQAIRANIPTIAPISPGIVRARARLVGRFYEDCFSYVDIDSNPVLLFGLLTGLVNHSCSANASIDAQLQEAKGENLADANARIFVRATKKIIAGEEITLNYVRDIEDNRSHHRAEIFRVFGFPCMCSPCVQETNDPLQRDTRNVVYSLICEAKYVREEMAKGVHTCRRARWIIDGCDMLDLRHESILEVLEDCFWAASNREDYVRATYFGRKRLELIRTWYGAGSDRFTESENNLRGFCAMLDSPEAFGLSKHLHDLAEDEQLAEETMVQDKIYLVHPTNNRLDWEKEPNEELRDILKAYNCLFQHTKSGSDAGGPRDLAVVAEEEDKAAKPQTHPPKKDGNQARRKKKKPARPANESDEDTPPPPPAFSPADYAYSTEYCSPFAAKDGVSKQVWLSCAASKARFANSARDIEHLIAAKDGVGSKSDGFGLRARRDSTTGRIQGYKEFLEVENGVLGRKRAHSFNNDGGKNDFLKEAEF